MEFALFKELAELEGLELGLLIGAVVAVVALAVALVMGARRRAAAQGAAAQGTFSAAQGDVSAAQGTFSAAQGAAAQGTFSAAQGDASAAPARRLDVHALVLGAMCVALSFMLSYIKLFSMPLGGSVTLCSMLPICLYGYWYGPKHGFTAAFAYALLQIAQGAWIVHWAQFLLDYIVAFLCFGLASLFPRRFPLGLAVSGLSRMAASMASGLIFFASSAAEAGYRSAFLYSLVYNGSTIGVDAVLCVIVALLPPVARMTEKLRPR